jgi:hypothetical protein
MLLEFIIASDCPFKTNRSLTQCYAQRHVERRAAMGFEMALRLRCDDRDDGTVLAARPLQLKLGLNFRLCA